MAAGEPMVETVPGAVATRSTTVDVLTTVEAPDWPVDCCEEMLAGTRSGPFVTASPVASPVLTEPPPLVAPSGVTQ